MRHRWHILTRRVLPGTLGGLISLAIAQAIDLGHQTLGGGPGAVAPIIGDTVGLLACGSAAFIAVSQIRTGALRRC